jgi:hypothetical protein
MRPGHAADDRILRIEAVGEEEREVGREGVHRHPARQVVLDVGEPVGERERQLRDRVRSRLGDVVARNRHRVEVLHAALDEVLLHVTHHAQGELGREDAGVLCLILLEDVGLHGAAHPLQRLLPDARIDVGRQDLVTADAQEGEAQTIVALGQGPVVAGSGLPALAIDLIDPTGGRLQLAFRRQPALALLVDGRVEEEGEQHRRRAVDRHRNRRRRIAQVEARVQLLGVVDRRDADTRIAHLAVDVGPGRRVLAIQRHGIEGRRQALRRQAPRDEVEALVRALGPALAGEHARGVFALPLEREDAGREREHPGRRLGEHPAKDVAPVLEGRQRHARNAQPAQRLRVERLSDDLVAHLVLVAVGPVTRDQLRPLLEDAPTVGGELALEPQLFRLELREPPRRLRLPPLGPHHARHVVAHVHRRLAGPVTELPDGPIQLVESPCERHLAFGRSCRTPR